MLNRFDRSIVAVGRPRHGAGQDGQHDYASDGNCRWQRIAPRPADELLQWCGRTGGDGLASEEAAQIAGQLCGCSVAVGRRLFEALQANGFEVTWTRWPQA